jgi:hypothetical protein
VESAKNQRLRDFRRRSVFDFCNTIGTFATCRYGRLESAIRSRADVGRNRHHGGDRDLGDALRAQIIEVADRLPLQIARAALVRGGILEA